MISTVTTTTISTVTSMALASSLGLVVVITLLIMLVQKEAVMAAVDPRARALGRTLNVAIVPLLLAFAMIALMKVVDIVG